MAVKITTIDGVTYEVGQLSAMKQFHVSRRLLPLVGALAPYLGELTGPGSPLAEPDEDPGVAAAQRQAWMAKLLDKAVPAIAEILAKLDDAEAEYVIKECLSVVSVQQERGWAKLTTPTGVSMFPLTLPVMLQLTGEVITENLGSFFPTGKLEGSAAAGSTSSLPI